MGQTRSHSLPRVPFSWERKPGVPKVAIAQSFPREYKFVPKLQPPPYTAKTARNSFQIPRPSCAIQPPYYRSFSKKSLIQLQDHDPFFAAYNECTKSTKSVERSNKLQIKTSIETRLRNSMAYVSCKRSCAVRDNNLVRISHLPHHVDKE